MEDELRLLKECLDETVLKDMELSKSLKRNIIKQTKASSGKFRGFHMLKYAVSLVIAVCCFILLGQSFLPSQKNKQASSPSVHQQQVALIHFQNDIINLLRTQHQSETAYLTALSERKPQDEIERYREECLMQGEFIIEGLEKIVIPPELSSYNEKISHSLEVLARGYQLKNDYYKGLKGDTFRGLTVSGDLEYVDVLLFQFDQILRSVYEGVELKPVSYVWYFNLRDY